MPDRARILTVLRRARDMCLRPWTRSRPQPAAAGRPQSGPRRAGPGQPQHAGPGEHITMPVIGGRILRVAMREGNPACQPLLLCNGFGASLEMLQPFVDALDPRRAIIRFDMPGLGGSPAPVLPYHLATTPLLSGILDQLGYQQADVLGISWGGGLAQQFALRCPARVRRLVLVATAPGALMVPGSPRILLRMLTPRRHQDPGYAARLAGELFGGSTREDSSSARDLLRAVTRPGPARGSFYQLISLAGWTSLPRLPRLRRPALILAGDDDPIIPLANARIMHRLMPRSELHIYHGGHLDLVLEAEQMAAIVESFLTAGNDPQPGAAHHEADRPRRSNAALRRVRAGRATGHAAAGPPGN